MPRLTDPQRRDLRNLREGRLPTFGVPLAAAHRGGLQQTLRALEQRGLVVKRNGRWAPA